MIIIFNNINLFVQDFNIKTYQKLTCKIANFYHETKNKRLIVKNYYFTSFSYVEEKKDYMILILTNI